MVGPRESLSIMVNEEDHLRMQAVVSGFRLGEALDIVGRVDDALDRHLSFAFSPMLGFLTSCPTNVGTGLRASVLVHLPALHLTGDARKVMQGAAALGMAVRGFYGEGTEVMGNFVQVSNHVTLGKDEGGITNLMAERVHIIIAAEEKARDTVWSSARLQVEDKVYRAFGILRHARSLKAPEVLNLASAVRFGISLELPDLCPLPVLNEILLFAQPGHLSRVAGRELQPDERRGLRAQWVRRRLAAIPWNGV
jgi:protein arginine kinase